MATISPYRDPKPAEEAATQFVTIPLQDFVVLTQAAALLSVVVNDDTFHHTAVPAVKTTLEALAQNQEELAQNQEAGAAE